jgi:tRNA uridine 5-carboxymethylaminomethyl modification enzyme
VVTKQKQVAAIKSILKNTVLEPVEANPVLEQLHSAQLTDKQRIEKIILRPNIGIKDLSSSIPKLAEALAPYEAEAIEQAEIQTKYEVYIEKERALVERMRLMEDLAIPSQFDYGKILALSTEAREKLNKIKPLTLGQASRISGINPSDVQILMVYMGR